MVLDQPEVDLDPEEASYARAYQTEALLRWSEYHHRQYRRRLAAQHLDQHAIGVIGGYQLQAGASAQEFGQFLKTLEAAGKNTKTLWAGLVRQVYDKMLVVGNLCSIGIVLGVLGQLAYNGTKIIEALKGQAYQLGLATILRAFCCGIAAFILKAKYDDAMTTSTSRTVNSSSERDEEVFTPMDIDDCSDVISMGLATKRPRSEGTAPCGGTSGSAKEEGAGSKL